MIALIKVSISIWSPFTNYEMTDISKEMEELTSRFEALQGKFEGLKGKCELITSADLQNPDRERRAWKKLSTWSGGQRVLIYLNLLYVHHNSRAPLPSRSSVLSSFDMNIYIKFHKHYWSHCVRDRIKTCVCKNFKHRMAKPSSGNNTNQTCNSLLWSPCIFHQRREKKQWSVFKAGRNNGAVDSSVNIEQYFLDSEVSW